VLFRSKAGRTAATQGDRRGQVAAALAVLKSGATGYARAEALKSACDAYEALGEPDRAEPFCQTLLSEFRSTAAAQQVAQRRKAAAPTGVKAARDAAEAKPAAAPIDAAAH
jgi:hypothetical protein